MVAPVNPIREEMMKKINETKRNGERINEIVRQGFISRRFGEYAKQLLILDFLADESEVLARYRQTDRAINSLTEMKFGLDGVAGVLMADGELETEKMGKFSIIKNPNFDNVEKYKGLYDFAQSKYEDAVNKCSSLLEAA